MAMRESSSWCERTTLESPGERLAFDVLHDQIVGAVLTANVIERANIWMVQAGDGAGFTFETLAHLRCVCQMWRENFQRYGTRKTRVSRAVNFTHATRANRRNDFVGT